MENLIKEVKKNYKKLRKEVSEKNIHKLRTSFKKLRAVYGLNRGLGNPVEISDELKKFYKTMGKVRDIQILNKFESETDRELTPYSLDKIQEFVDNNENIELEPYNIYDEEEVRQYVSYNIDMMKTKGFIDIEEIHYLRKIVKNVMYVIKEYKFENMGHELLEKAANQLGEWHDKQINVERFPEFTNETYNLMQDGLETIRILKRFQCKKCGVSTFHDNHNYYMVHNDIWNNAVEDKQVMLCIPCLEELIGRKLTYEDFTKAPVNEMNKYVQSLKNEKK
jgi:CHAD domain-containing protein